MKRDEEWFEGIFQSHSEAVYRFFARRAPRDECEDLTADVFTTAWRKREVVPEEAVLPWLYKTSGYLLMNHRRKSRALPTDKVQDLLDLEPAVELVSDAEVRDVLELLSPRDQQILMLKAWDGLDGDQLAAALGISRGGADAALSRARARLEEAWAVQVQRAL